MFDRNLLRQARRSRLALSLTIGLGFAAGVFTLGQAALVTQVISRVFLGGQGLEAVSRPLALLLGVMIGRALLSWGSEAAAVTIALRVKSDLRRLLYEHITRLGPTYARGERSGELAHTLGDGVEALDAYFSQYLPQLALAALVPLSFLIFVFPLDPLSGFVLLFTAPLIPVFMILIGNLAKSLTRKQWVTLSRLSAYFLDVLQGLTTLKELGRSRGQAQTIAAASEQFRVATMNVLKVTFLSALALEMVSTLSTAVVAVQIGLRLLYGWLTFDQAFFILLLAPEFYLPLRLLGTRFHAGMSGVEAAKRIFEILETPVPLSEAVSSSQPAPWGTITFEEVSFHYPQEGPDTPAGVEGLSFHLQPGEKLALVGPSGGGKSTIAALLLRFLEPESGRILVDGVPLQEVSPEVWRERVAWVPQTPYLFQDTLSANLRLACPQASQEAIEAAARQASAHEFIEQLPQKYETQLGERGLTLSGGQAQRVALARAFLKDAPLLILDEATAHLDPELETSLQDAIRRLMQGRSSLVIAHRLNTVQDADQILVLQMGRIVQRGTHAQLMAQEGLYRGLVQAQEGQA